MISPELPEGAEAAPPGVRAMGIVRWALVALMAAAAAGAWVYWAKTGAQVESAGTQWRCPMHPAVLQSHPGECPVCGMDLVAAAGTGSGPAAATAAAPQSPSVAAGKYWCPMHPEVSSDDPEARCSKCGGMKLVPREPARDPRAAPPGLAAIDVGAERAQKIGVRTVPVRKRNLMMSLRTTGSIAVDEGAVTIVTARVTGWVEELRVRQSGQRVARGEILGTLYSPDLVTAQQVHLSTARPAGRADAQSAAAGPGSQVVPGRRLDLLGVAKQDVDRLERTGSVVNAMPFRSPVDGYVVSKIEAPGAYVQPGTELFRIADLSTLSLVTEVAERDAKRVRVGQGATFFPTGGSGESYAGKIDLVYPALDPGTRMLSVRIKLRNENLELRPGATGDVLLHVSAVEGLVVPRDALVETGEAQYVFVARDAGRFEPRSVRVGTREDDHVIVLEGVSEGERVVTAANFMIDAESRLRAAVEAFGK